ncbi:MAG: DinB family protein [Thermomicrobiales bacterium]
MDSRGYQLANAFDAATDRLVERIRSMSDTQWTAKASGEEWTVAQEALHLGIWMDIEGDWYARLANGKAALPLSKDAADRINAWLIAENPEPTREQVLLSIAGNRTLVRHLLIGLSDDQLARTIPLGKAFVSGSNDVEISLDDLANRMLVGHVENHLQTIEATIASA